MEQMIMTTISFSSLKTQKTFPTIWKTNWGLAKKQKNIFKNLPSRLSENHSCLLQTKSTLSCASFRSNSVTCNLQNLECMLLRVSRRKLNCMNNKTYPCKMQPWRLDVIPLRGFTRPHYFDRRPTQGPKSPKWML